MRKISRSQLRAWAIGHIKTKQGGLCPLCGKPISLQVMGNNPTTWLTMTTKREKLEACCIAHAMQLKVR